VAAFVLLAHVLAVPGPIHQFINKNIVSQNNKAKDIKPGHDMVKEYHFHPYWHQNNQQEEAAVIALRDAIIDEVAAGNMTVVCNGVTSDMVPGLDESKIPGFHTGPMGPHPVGSFEIWTPQEYLPHMLSFMMYHRGDINVLFHPLGEGAFRDHTHDAMWLGQSYPIDLSVFSSEVVVVVGGDPAQYPELGLGYSKV